MFAYEKYMNTAATTSNTSNQLVFIFDEILKLLHTAHRATQKQDLETKYKSISSIIDAFYILKSGIDPETADESNQKIDLFYGATINKLEEINIKKDSLEDIGQMIEDLGEVRSALINSAKDNSNETSNSSEENNNQQAMQTIDA